MRIFLDANILFSAAKSNGAIRCFLMMLLEKKHELRISFFVQEEALRNLQTKAPDSVRYLEELKKLITLIPEAKFLTPLPLMASSLPMKDRPVLQAAIHDQCDILLTGDKLHFGEFFGRKIEKVAVHSPRSLAELLGMTV